MLVVSDKPEIDDAVWSLWVRGFMAIDAAQHLITHSYDSSLVTDPEAQLTSLNKHVEDQYVIFDHFQDYMVAPLTLHIQTAVPFLAESLPQYLSEFYSIDEVLWWEIYGRKLSILLRKDTIADIAEKGHVPPRSVARQMENIANIAAAMRAEENTTLVDRIRTEFLISEGLSEAYARLAFSMYHRIDRSSVPMPSKIATTVSGARPFCALDSVTDSLMALWGSTTGLDLNQTFIASVQLILRLHSEDQLAGTFYRVLNTNSGRPEDFPASHPVWGMLSKSVLSIASELCSPTGLSHLFDTMQARLVTPTLKAGIDLPEVQGMCLRLAGSAECVGDRGWVELLGGIAAGVSVF